MRRFLTMTLAALTLSACASALSDSQQRVEVVTPGANDAYCILDNGETKYKVWTPGTVMMSKRPNDLVVTCKADGNRDKTIVIDPESNPVALGNAFNGFIPGIFIDHETGALFQYPNKITVDFTDMQATAMPLPYYHRHLMENPDLFGMEEFRSGRAALIRDRYDEGYELQKRDFSGSVDYSEFSSVPASEAAASDEGEESSSSASSGASSTAGPGDDMISDLTRQMNPQVFGTTNGADTGGFVGGTNTTSGGASDEPLADTGPVSIYPMEESN